MSFDFGGSFDAGSIDSAPTDVPADVNVDPSSADYGSEQLTTDQAANPGDQVANQSGNSDFVNATDPSATQTAPETPSGYQNEASQLADGNGTATPSAIDGLKDQAGALADKAKNAATGALDQIQAKASSTLTNFQNQFTADNISKFATKTASSLITQVENTAINLAKNAANQALSTVVGPAAAATITGGVTRSLLGPTTGNATPVSKTTNPAAAQSDDVAKLNADGSVDLSQFNKGPTQLPTNYTGEAQSLLTPEQVQAADNPVDTTTDPTLATPPANPGSTTLDKSPAAVAGDPNAVGPPTSLANPGSIAEASANNAAVNATDAGLVGPPVSLSNPGSIAAAAMANQALVAAASSTTALLTQAQNQQTARQQYQNQAQAGDWRVRLSLAPSSNYLYNDPNCGPVLWPLYLTGGVIFPYTPSIDLGYKANYTPYDLTHSNYRGYFYQNSYVDGVNIKATFTAQDTAEANYLLAVIHFFRSVTKMFYGQDAQAGSPPPLVFLSGLGDFQFNQHPCVVSQFNYSLPADVNYIRAQSVGNNGTNQLAARTRSVTLGNPISNAIQRLASLGQGINPGALTAPYSPQGSLAAGNPTYVPTKIEVSLVLLPMQTRSQVSQQFSLKAFANGNLLKGGFW